MEIRKNGIENSMFKCFAERAPKILDINSLKDLYFGGVWNTWPEELVKREPETIKKYETLLSEEIRFFKFLQFKFFTQWLKLKEYAASKNIEIIGDIPIFAAYDSADVWANQNLFELNESGFPINVAGVPPNYFSSTGQLWGNPLYVWKNHAETGYDWWIKRVKNQLSLFDILRIDHFRGFESYYSIPFGNPDATCGKWMKGPGRGLFDAIKKELGSLPIIAEDLGVITPPVAKLRQSLNLPGMKILQFAFDNSENNQYLPHNYDKNCVVYTGTHDNDTTVGWYNAADESRRRLFPPIYEQQRKFPFMGSYKACGFIMRRYGNIPSSGRALPRRFSPNEYAGYKRGKLAVEVRERRTARKPCRFAQIPYKNI